MAVTLGAAISGGPTLPTRDHVIGNRREIVTDIALDNSYPTGGYSLDANTGLGLDLVLDSVTVTFSDGHVGGYDYANKKLKVFSAGTEVSNATDLSAVKGRLVARGKGVGHPVS